LKRGGIAFLASVNGFVHNAAQFFSGTELAIGDVVISTPYQHFYVQQKISKMGKKKLEPYANGLCMQLDSTDQLVGTVNGVLSNMLLSQANDGGGPAVGAVTAAELVALSNDY
jgi:hypothetical protein